MTERVCVVMPTYNERDNLEPTLSDIFVRNPGVDVLIVDDASPDGTGVLADAISRSTNLLAGLTAHANHSSAQGTAFLSDATMQTTDLKIANRVNSMTTDSRVFVLHREGKLGLGSAYIEGFQWALAQGYDVICEMDMDGSHRAEDLHVLLEHLRTHEDVDLVLGSRRVSGGSTQDWPWYRDAISRAGSRYARVMLGLNIHDMTSGFRAYRADVLRRIALDEIDDNGYVFQIDMTRRVAALNATIVEVPIVFPERERGESKMNGSIVREAMQKVTQWGVMRVWNNLRSGVRSDEGTPPAQV